MSINHELSQQIVDQVKQVLAKNIAIANRDGIILASSTEEEVGTLIEESTTTTEEPAVVKHGQRTLVIAPLHFDNSHAANLIIYDDEAWQDHVKLVTSLAELLGERYLELQTPPVESKDLIIHRLLNTQDPAQLAELEAEAQRAGFDLDRPRIAMIFQLSQFWQTFFKGEEGAESREANISRFHNKIAQALNSFFTSSQDNIISYIGDDRFVVLKDVSTSPEEKFLTLLNSNYQTIFDQVKSPAITNITVGIGGYYEGIEGLQTSYNEAAIALELGERMWGEGHVYHINNLGIPGLLAEASSEKKLDFADRLLGPLLPHRELVHTMEEFFKYNLNLTNTAEALKIHRNTLIYRLDKISSIINLDPRFFQEAVQIYLALMIKRILGDK